MILKPSLHYGILGNSWEIKLGISEAPGRAGSRTRLIKIRNGGSRGVAYAVQTAGSPGQHDYWIKGPREWWVARTRHRRPATDKSC